MVSTSEGIEILMIRHGTRNLQVKVAINTALDTGYHRTNIAYQYNEVLIGNALKNYFKSTNCHRKIFFFFITIKLWMTNLMKTDMKLVLIESLK